MSNKSIYRELTIWGNSMWHQTLKMKFLNWTLLVKLKQINQMNFQITADRRKLFEQFIFSWFQWLAKSSEDLEYC
jgi:hypothetical protein